MVSDKDMSLSDSTEVDPFAPRLKSSACAKCGEKFMRPEDRNVHQERHRPAPDLPKEERVGKVHCPKGCGRWMEPESADSHAHIALCDGAEPISPDRTNPSAYRWWCEEHQFGTNGPRPWGDHKKEHHGGGEPVGKISQEVRKKKQENVIPEVVKTLRGELGRLGIERVKIEMEETRICAAIKALESDLRTQE